MAKNRIVTVSGSAAERLRRLLSPNAGAVEKNSLRNNPQAGWFHAIIVATGPDAESDWSDHRYWVKKCKPSNYIDDEDTLATDALTVTPIVNGDETEVWVTATNKGESSEETHDLPTDGTQQVTVQWTYDAPTSGTVDVPSGGGGQIRFFFYC